MIAIVLLYIVAEILPQNFLYISKASEPHAATSGYRSPPIFLQITLSGLPSLLKVLAYVVL